MTSIRPIKMDGPRDGSLRHTDVTLFHITVVLYSVTDRDY